jgi:hypothetical protein
MELFKSSVDLAWFYNSFLINIILFESKSSDVTEWSRRQTQIAGNNQKMLNYSLVHSYAIKKSYQWYLMHLRIVYW